MLSARYVLFVVKFFFLISIVYSCYVLPISVNKDVCVKFYVIPIYTTGRIARRRENLVESAYEYEWTFCTLCTIT